MLTCTLELVAVLLAGAAFAVSFVTLYLTVLRRADIRIDFVEEGQPVIRGPGFSGPVLSLPQSITVPVFAANLGAHGGLLAKVELADLTYEGADPPLWTTIGVNSYVPPRGYEAGDVKPANLTAQLHGDPINTPQEGAERVRGLTSVRLTIRWTFLRTPGPLTALVRRTGASEPVTRSFEISLDCRPYHDEVLAHWRHRKEWHSLLEIAQQGSTPDH